MKKTLWSMMALFSFLFVSHSAMAKMAVGASNRAAETAQASGVTQEDVSATATQKSDEYQSDTYGE